MTRYKKLLDKVATLNLQHLKYGIEANLANRESTPEVRLRARQQGFVSRPSLLQLLNRFPLLVNNSNKWQCLSVWEHCRVDNWICLICYTKAVDAHFSTASKIKVALLYCAHGQVKIDLPVLENVYLVCQVRTLMQEAELADPSPDSVKFYDEVDLVSASHFMHPASTESNQSPFHGMPSAVRTVSKLSAIRNASGHVLPTVSCYVQRNV